MFQTVWLDSAISSGGKMCLHNISLQVRGVLSKKYG